MFEIKCILILQVKYAACGYSHIFVYPPPCEVTCKICQLPCKESQISLCCKNNFCAGHVTTTKDGDSYALQKECPICCSDKFEYFPDNQADEKIQSLLIYCPNKDVGCNWIGQLSQVYMHCNDDNSGCLLKEIRCTSNCGKVLQRQHLSDHLLHDCSRYCPYCKRSTGQQEIVKFHKENCQKYPIVCPNNCGVTVSRDEIAEHKNICPLQEIDCEYYKIGCRDKILCKDKEWHYKNKISKHLDLMKQQISDEKVAQKYCIHLAYIFCCGLLLLAIICQYIYVNHKYNEIESDRYIVYNEMLGNLKIENDDLKYEMQHLDISILLLTMNLHLYATTKDQMKFLDVILQKAHIGSINDIDSCAMSIRNLNKSFASLKEIITKGYDHVHSSSWKLHLRILNLLSLHGDQVTPVVFAMLHYSKWSKEKKPWFSTVFFDVKGGNQLCLLVTPINVTVSVSLILLTPAPNTNLHYDGVFAIELLNQINDTNHLVNDLSFNKVAPSKQSNEATYTNLKYLSSHQDDVAFLTEDRLYFRVSFYK